MIASPLAVSDKGYFYLSSHFAFIRPVHKKLPTAMGAQRIILISDTANTIYI